MSQAATIRVTLSPPLSRYVREKVATGRFESPSEVIRQSLTAMKDREREDKAYWDDVNAKIAEAEMALARGEVGDGPTFMRKMKRKLLAQKSRQARRK